MSSTITHKAESKPTIGTWNNSLGEWIAQDPRNNVPIITLTCGKKSFSWEGELNVTLPHGVSVVTKQVKLIEMLHASISSKDPKACKDSNTFIKGVKEETDNGAVDRLAKQRRQESRDRLA